MQRIVALAETRKRAASQGLAAASQRHGANLAKLAEFRRYLDEYRGALTNPGTAMSASAARELREFMGQIERTISALEGLSQRSGAEHARELAVWKREAQRLNALGEVLERVRADEVTVAEQRAQRELDDRAPRPTEPA